MRCKSISKCWWECNSTQSVGLIICHCLLKLNIYILTLLPIRYFPKRDVSICAQIDVYKNVHNHIICNIQTLEKSKWLSILEGIKVNCVFM